MVTLGSLLRNFIFSANLLKVEAEKLCYELSLTKICYCWRFLHCKLPALQNRNNLFFLIFHEEKTRKLATLVSRAFWHSLFHERNLATASNICCKAPILFRFGPLTLDEDLRVFQTVPSVFLNTYRKEDCFKQKLYRETQQTFYIFYIWGVSR
jgi:hypothetical protein